MNIDGYLGDFCKFNLELSRIPKGLPITTSINKLIKLKGTAANEAVILKWYATQSQLDSIGSFEIYRSKKTEVKSTLIASIPVYSNALGSRNENYAHIDSLFSDGEYRYRVIGISKITHSRTLLDEVLVEFYPEHDYTAIIPLNFSKKGALTIFILDAENSNRTLHAGQYNYLQPGNLPVSLTEYAQIGIKRFWIKIRNERTKESRLFGYYIDEMSHLQSIN